MVVVLGFCLLLISASAAYAFFNYGKHKVTVCNNGDQSIKLTLFAADDEQNIEIFTDINLSVGSCLENKISITSDMYFEAIINDAVQKFGYLTSSPFVTRHEIGIVGGLIKYNQRVELL